MAVYFATKAFVLSFSEALHEEVKRHGVTVSALCPGPTATEFGEVAGFGPSNLLDKVAADSASVVRAGLAGLDKGKAVIIPGLMNKSTAQAHRFFPRSWVRKAAGMLKP
jgi:short-subunit dehydrogenase